MDYVRQLYFILEHWRRFTYVADCDSVCVFIVRTVNSMSYPSMCQTVKMAQCVAGLRLTLDHDSDGFETCK